MEAVDIPNSSRNEVLAAVSVISRFINVSSSRITEVTSDLNRVENAMQVQDRKQLLTFLIKGHFN